MHLARGRTADVVYYMEGERAQGCPPMMASHSGDLLHIQI